MSLRKFIIFILAVVIGGESAFAVGAVALYDYFKDGRFVETLYFTVTGLPSEQVARKRIIEIGVDPEGNNLMLGQQQFDSEGNLFHSGGSIYIVPNGMHHLSAHCYEMGIAEQFNGPIESTVGDTIQMARDKVIKQCKEIAPSRTIELFDEKIFSEPIPVPVTNSDNGSGNTFLYVGGAVVALGALYFFTSPKSVGQFSFSPNYHYRLTDNSYSYSAASRLQYDVDDWRFYWLTGANNNSDNVDSMFYGTGAEYNGDVWNATFSEDVQGDNVDYRFELSSRLDFGNWQFMPTYALHSRHENLSTDWQSETKNSLNLQGAWHNGSWKVKPSASIQWQDITNFGDNTQFDMTAVWQF